MAATWRPPGRGRVVGAAVLLVASAAAAVASPVGASTSASGHVTFGGIGQPGVQVDVQNGSETVTDADGAFTSTCQSSGLCFFGVSAFGNATNGLPQSTHVRTFVDFSTVDDLDVAFPAPAPLTVRVREQGGAPVDDALVRSVHTDDGEVTYPGTLYDFTAQANETTGPSGDVTLRDMVGTSEVSVSHSSGGLQRKVVFEDFEVPAGGTTIDAVLPTPVVVTGHVLVDGAPQGGAEVVVRAADGSGVMVDRTDAEGAFSLQAVPGPSLLTVRTSVPGPSGTNASVEAQSEVDVGEGGEDFDVALPAAIAVSATVVDTAGAPVEHARVEVRGPEGTVSGLTLPGSLVSLVITGAAGTDANGDALLATYPGSGRDVVAHQDTSHPTDGFPYPQYQRRVEAEDLTLAADDHVDLTLAALPGVPSDVTMEVTGHRQAKVSWSPPALDVGTPVTGYGLLIGRVRFVGRFDVEPPGLVELGAEDRSTTISITPGTDTFLRLYALTDGGAGPDADGSVQSPLLLPGPPTGVSVEPQPGAVDVAWSPPADDPGLPITGYRVTSGPANLTFPTVTQDLGPGELSTTIGDLPNARAVNVGVRALTEDGPGPVVSEVVTPRLPHRVDVRTAARGNDEYGNGRNDQVLFADLSKRATGRFPFVVENDGSTTERMVVRDRTTSRGLRVRWFDGRREVTAAVDAGRYRTPVLAPGASHRLVAVTTVTPGWPRGYVEVLTLQASPAQAPAQHDKVTYWVTIRR